MRAIVLGLLLLFVPLPAHAAAVTETHFYAGTTDTEQTVDVTYDPGLVDQPWVAVVHGGSWVAGSKASQASAASKFAAAGFVVFNVEYRKVTDYAGNPGVTWDEQLGDVNAALDWIRANHVLFGIDPDRGAIYGFSAGGHLAMSAGLEGNRVKAIVSASGVLQPHRVLDAADGLKADDPSTANNRTLARWASVAMRCPNLPWAACTDRWGRFKPENRLDPADPPMMIFQGTADPSVPSGTGKAFAYWAQRQGIETVLVEGVGWGHTEALAFDGGARQANMINWLKAKTS